MCWLFLVIVISLMGINNFIGFEVKSSSYGKIGNDAVSIDEKEYGCK